MWSNGRSEAALGRRLSRFRSKSVRLRTRPPHAAAVRRGRADVLKLTCPGGTSRRAALAWALDQRDWIEAQLRASRAAGAVRARARSIPLEGTDVRIVWARDAPRTPHARATMSFAAAGRAKASSGGSSSSSRSCALETSCRATSPSIAAAAGVTAARGQRRRRGDALGQLLVGRPDPTELAADPRAGRGAPLRRRARGRAPRPPQSRAGVQGARSAAVRARPRRGEGAATACRAAAATDRAEALRRGCGCRACRLVAGAAVDRRMAA